MRTSLVKAVSVAFYTDAFMWLVGVVPTLAYASAHRALPSVGGMRLLSGPFEALGIDSLIVAGLIYAVVSALKIMAAYWLWNSRMDGAVLGLVLLGTSTIFWYGFALPLGPLLGIIQLALLALVRKTLR
jgi:hypothetical protein